jgi:Holliday junction DNA helicase RuvA
VPLDTGEAWREQVREALVGLGWTVRQAEDALDKVAPQAAEGAGVSALLRAALQELGR